MKVITVLGLTGSGKTTVIEGIISELKRRGYTVGSIKQIHNENFKMDTEGKNTWRHRQAGADTVTARSHQETDILYAGELPIYEVLSHYSEDFVIMEGVRDAVVPEIITCKEEELPVISPLTIAISGRYANNKDKEYKGLPVINGTLENKHLVDLIISKTPVLMPDIDPKCCSKCGYDCRTFLSKLLKEEIKQDDCVLRKGGISLRINGDEIPMVPFVENILKNEILGVVKELKGYKNNSNIEIKFLSD